MISAIVLAAGRSRRMGTQKLLLPFAGQTVIGHIVDQILAGGIDNLLVVVGADRCAVADALAGRKIGFVENPEPEADMLSSVRCGLRALPASCDAALIVLGDQPGIRGNLVSRLVSVFGESDEGIVVPIYNGQRGHPVIILSQYFAEVLANFDGIGLHGLLAAHPTDVRELAVDDPTVLADIDYPHHYQRQISAPD